MKDKRFKGCMTVQQLVDALQLAAKQVPTGMNTPVACGDSYGNTVQGPSLEIKYDDSHVSLIYDPTENIIEKEIDWSEVW